MTVPNNNTFTLQDVVTEINPTVDSLTGCFADAVTAGFNPTYSGAKDRLSNFRAYAHALITSNKSVLTIPFPKLAQATNNPAGITVIPSSTSVTVTRVDTGYGIFCTLSTDGVNYGSTLNVTGSFSLYVKSGTANNEFPRTMDVRVQSNSSGAVYCVIEVTQEPDVPE